jgi:hypothetical protein
MCWIRLKLHCIYQALIVAMTTRVWTPAVIKSLTRGRPIWLALPHPTWVEYNQCNGRVIIDPLAVQDASRFLKAAIESGTYEHGREMYALTVGGSARRIWVRY